MALKRMLSVFFDFELFNIIKIAYRSNFDFFIY